MAQAWIERLSTRTTEPAVKEVSIPPDQSEEYLNLIEKYPYDPDFLGYHVLFKMMGWDLDRIKMAIPFLRRDKYYNVPGIDKKRFNIENDPTTLPEVPLVVADVREEIPVADKSVDILVLNQGVILTEMPEMERYFDHVKRVVKPGGMVIVIDSQYEIPDFPDCCATGLGASKVRFNVPGNIMEAMRKRTGQDGAYKFEDFFPKPDYKDVNFSFLQMAKN